MFEYLLIAIVCLSLPLTGAFFFAMMLTLRPWTRVRIITLVFFLTSPVLLLMWFAVAEEVERDLGLGSEFAYTGVSAAVPLVASAVLVALSTRSIWVGLPPFLFAALSAITSLNPGWPGAVEEVLVIPPSLAGAASILPALAIWTAVTRYREPFAGHPFHCHKCGYSMTGLKARRCPECGTPLGTA